MPPIPASIIPHPLTLWYGQPARQWEEALPVGNGRLGAMVFGGNSVERMQLNEDTLWSGGPKEWDNPQAADYLADVRRLIFARQYAEADELCQKMQGRLTNRTSRWATCGSSGRPHHPPALPGIFPRP